MQGSGVGRSIRESLKPTPRRMRTLEGKMETEGRREPGNQALSDGEEGGRGRGEGKRGEKEKRNMEEEKEDKKKKERKGSKRKRSS